MLNRPDHGGEGGETTRIPVGWLLLLLLLRRSCVAVHCCPENAPRGCFCGGAAAGVDDMAAEMAMVEVVQRATARGSVAVAAAAVALVAALGRRHQVLRQHRGQRLAGVGLLDEVHGHGELL
jgi:hypothetical protein